MRRPMEPLLCRPAHSRKMRAMTRQRTDEGEMPSHHSMSRLIGIGLLAAFFFSSTFALNRAMSLQGGR